MADARYLVSARKYRPQTFADFVSQEHVTGTLQNAIRLDRLAHAYLFSGPRGVGKTTAARLLAKAINCQTPLDDRDGAEPCRACEACTAFEEGRSLNVIEMDAASNNGVEYIRELRETVRIPPQGARRKIYIIDEVHMLSASAFNAFLKTLEEPPPHALFIFATTEPHKVLPTILSRCQRFDFRRITVAQIVERLREIALAEGITADDGALHLVARKGDGALRDALSLFDQAVALCGTDLAYPALVEALGVVDRDLFFEVVRHADARETGALIALVDRVARRGYDLAEFVAGLGEHLRNLYVAVSTGGTALIEADEALRARYAEAAAGRAEADLLRALMVIDEVEREMRHSSSPRMKVELGLLKLAHLEPVADLAALLAQLERLGPGEPLATAPGRVSEPAAPGSARPSGTPAGGAAPNPAAPTYRASASPTPLPEVRVAPPPAPPENRPPANRPPENRPSDVEPPTAFAPPDARPSSGPTPSPPWPEDEAPRRPPPPPAAPPAPAPPASGVAESLFGPPALRPRTSPGPADAASGDGGAVAIAPPVADPHFGLPLGRVREAWPELVRRVRAQRPSVAMVLALAEPAGLTRGAVEIAVPDDFTRRLLHDERDAFTDAMREVLGGDPPPLAFVVRRDAAETAVESDPFEALKQLRQEHPVLRFLFERFSTELVWT